MIAPALEGRGRLPWIQDFLFNLETFLLHISILHVQLIVPGLLDLDAGPHSVIVTEFLVMFGPFHV